jgi:hypothetical protein
MAYRQGYLNRSKNNGIICYLRVSVSFVNGVNHVFYEKKCRMPQFLPIAGFLILPGAGLQRMAIDVERRLEFLIICCMFR